MCMCIDCVCVCVCETPHLALVEVVDDLAAEPLLAMPLSLSRIVQELLQRPLVPVQQLPVQQQSERSLCGRRQQLQAFNTVCMSVCVPVWSLLWAVPV